MSEQFAIYPSLRDRVVFITGGASGIGAEHVAQFTAQGAKVAFVDIADDAARDLVGRLETAGHAPPFYQHCDLKDIDALRAAIAEVGRRLGPITVLVNNAAHDQRHKFEDVTVEYWDERQATNLRHQFFAIQAVAPMMRAAGGGSIINFGSVELAHVTGRHAGLYDGEGGGRGAVARDGAGSRRRSHPGEYGDPWLDHDGAADQAVADAGGRGESRFKANA